MGRRRVVQEQGGMASRRHGLSRVWIGRCQSVRDVGTRRGAVHVSLRAGKSQRLTDSTNHCPLPIIFAASNHVASLLKIAPKCPTLRIVVSMDPLGPSERELLSQWAASVDVELLDMSDLEKWGQEEGVKCEPGPVKGVAGDAELDKERVLTISYTSGTTGGYRPLDLLARADQKATPRVSC